MFNKHYILSYRCYISNDHEERTQESMHLCYNNPADKKGCVNPPLLNISIDKIIVDELHLMLRITDVLLRNLIWGMIAQDIIECHHSRPAIFLNKVVESIRLCGVTFKVKYN